MQRTKIRTAIVGCGKVAHLHAAALADCDAAYYRSDPWRGSWQGEGGGVLVNQAPHQLDLLLWYINAVEHYHRLQIADFLQSILEKRPPLVTGEQGRQTVELFTGIYRATRDRCAIRFPLLPEVERGDFDGRCPKEPMGRGAEVAGRTIS